MTQAPGKETEGREAFRCNKSLLITITGVHLLVFPYTQIHERRKKFHQEQKVSRHEKKKISHVFILNSSQCINY